ncbi:hypothetical protein V9T40_005656 [Parthenolecanium corni]|uniref:Uncharacterized protein n=1 Tax=Parthenolecanium corni TaxID=536013 RepID=A0AAN9TSY8_9HEMI
MEGESPSSPSSNRIVPSSLVVKTPSESSHSYARNGDPLQDYPAEDENETQVNDMRIVGVDTASRDECNAFGHYVATQLKKLDTKTCALVRFKICETLFNAEMGTLRKDTDT